MSISETAITESKGLIDRGCIVLDVREAYEVVAGHGPGAISAPLSVLTENVDAFPDGSTTYVICQAGGRSMRACEYLEGFGKQRVNVAGGTGAWIASGNVVVPGESPR